MKHVTFVLSLIITLNLGTVNAAATEAESLKADYVQYHDCSFLAELSSREWPKTDFVRCTVDPLEIFSGGPRKDGIPAIDHPKFVDIAAVDITATAPVIVIEARGAVRAYPLEILLWHEIVNDTFGGIPLAVTFCPLCNTSIVYERKLNGVTLDFGVSGRLRFSDMIMYDRQTESWWQQYGGDGIVGEHAGDQLKVYPSSVMSFEDFKMQYPQGTVLVPNDPTLRDYGINPYVGYDAAVRPLLFRGETPVGIKPMMPVVVLDDKAYSFDYLRKVGKVRNGNRVISYLPHVRTVLGKRSINESRNVGTVIVTENGKVILHKAAFAFVVHAFEPNKQIIH